MNKQAFLPYPGVLEDNQQTWRLRGAIPPSLLLRHLIPVILIFCSTAFRTIVVVPILIPPPLLLLRDSASVVSYSGQGGPPLGIDAQRWCRRRSRGVCICPHPEDGGHVSGRLFCEILRISHILRVSCRYLFLGKFRAQTTASDSTSIPLLYTLLSPLPTLPLLLCEYPLLPTP